MQINKSTTSQETLGQHIMLAEAPKAIATHSYKETHLYLLNTDSYRLLRNGELAASAITTENIISGFAAKNTIIALQFLKKMITALADDFDAICIETDRTNGWFSRMLEAEGWIFCHAAFCDDGTEKLFYEYTPENTLFPPRRE